MLKACSETMPKKKAKTLADFRAAFDPAIIVPVKIKAGLASLRKEGREAWEAESEFLQRAGVANCQISAYRDNFAAHIVEAGVRNPKRFWFADTKVAEKARKSAVFTRKRIPTYG